MEAVYQYIWKHSLWKLYADSVLSDGRKVCIISPGIHNRDSGPDFSDACIETEDGKWAGNVEVHIRASDWYRHGHDTDPAYDSVVLHVVAEDDARVCRRDGSEIPVIVIKASDSFLAAFESLSSPYGGKPICGAVLEDMPGIQRSQWLERMLIERLQTKGEEILRTLDFFKGDWEQACFTVVARALGFGLNAAPFETLARSVPLNILAHHSDDAVQLEALLFGQAGMLDMSSRIFDEYYQLLCREYIFLSRKYSLRPVKDVLLWKYARTRPANFPHRRIALLASYALGGFRMLHTIIEAGDDIDRLRTLFMRDLSSYWRTHFSFDSESTTKGGALTRQSCALMIINVAVPLNYAYGMYTGNDSCLDASYALLSGLHAENNSITRGWTSAGMLPGDARESQALLHLHRAYCREGRCLECGWGHRYISEQLRR